MEPEENGTCYCLTFYIPQTHVGDIFIKNDKQKEHLKWFAHQSEEKKTFIRKKGIDKINFPQNGQTGSRHKNPPHTWKFRGKEEGLTEALGYVQSYQRSINYQLKK